ncbi:MAG TPA: aminotransferase class V-fold PLP-dependent enzyme [Candidatus Magasanikbacteria bacterium]|nr:aminotransferase class V-fold PLP-dependent enzyme [Candidatus Magasanikbacteria bacterium]
MLPKPKKIHQVYFDHAATTYTDKAVVKAMMPYFTDIFGNPSSLYKIGREAQTILSNVRKTVAELIHAMPENIVFTAGGSESDNLAIFGTAYAHSQIGKHIISIGIEHHAVLYPLRELEKQGFEVTYLKVDKEGFVSVKDVISAIRPDTILITIMYANNEIGTLEPIAEIGRELLRYRKEKNTAYPYFHTDACQAAGYLDLDVEKLHVDLMTINGSKIYGPKGTGMLYVRRGIKIKPMIFGGAQEKKLRAGTENVPGIVGFVKALELAQKNKDKEFLKIQKLSTYLWNEVNKKIKKVRLNGPVIGDKRLPNNVNITFEDVEGEALLLYLDEYGVMCSTGSACTSESLEPSHVLRAIGLPYEFAHGSLRFSLGKENTKEDIDYMMKYLPQIVETLREISPVNMGKEKHPKYK